MLLRRRPHPALRLSTSLRRWVLAQLPRFLLIRLCRFLHLVLYYLTLPQLDLTEFLIGWINSDQPLDRRHLFCQSRHQYWAHIWHLYRRLDLNNQPFSL